MDRGSRHTGDDPILTHALPPDHPAIDAGNNTNSLALANDQRGEDFNRIEDGNDDGTATIDIGSFEVQQP